MRNITTYLLRALWNVSSRGLRTVGLPLLFLFMMIGAINIAAGDPVGIILLRVTMGIVAIAIIVGAIMLFIDSVKNEMENIRER